MGPLDVACSTCHADVGDACNWHPGPKEPHLVRIQLAKRLTQLTETYQRYSREPLYQFVDEYPNLLGYIRHGLLLRDRENRLSLAYFANELLKVDTYDEDVKNAAKGLLAFLRIGG